MFCLNENDSRSVLKTYELFGSVLKLCELFCILWIQLPQLQLMDNYNNCTACNKKLDYGNHKKDRTICKDLIMEKIK